LAPGDYVDRARLAPLRVKIARGELSGRMLATFSKVASDYFVTGEAGTFALVRESNVYPVPVTLHDTGTLDSLFTLDRGRSSVTFASETGLIFVATSAGIQRYELPQASRPVQMATIEPNTQIIVDEYMRLFSSTDGGRHWSRFDGNRSTWFAGSPLFSSIVIKPTTRGLFIYHRDSNEYDAILFGIAPYTQFEAIDSPRLNVKNPGGSRFIPTATGIVLDYLGAEFLVRPDASRTWEKRQKPTATCANYLNFKDNDGEELTVNCRQVLYESQDGGKNWRMR
jgi:hypothetical protein